MSICNFNITDLEEKLGLNINKELLVQALTHTSYVNENRHLGLESNQRLEFLGDAVLEIVISDYLYRTYPSFPEGSLTKIRAAVVCEPTLAYVAQSLKLGSYMLMGKGESKSGGRKRPSILADVFEALVGAIYVDQGMMVKEFILNHLQEALSKYSDAQHVGDYKSELQEFVQQRTDNVLKYIILKEEGPDHNKTFCAGVKMNDQLWGTGSGRTKKLAEQAAAEDALQRLAKGEISIG